MEQELKQLQGVLAHKAEMKVELDAKLDAFKEEHSDLYGLMDTASQRESDLRATIKECVGPCKEAAPCLR